MQGPPGQPYYASRPTGPPSSSGPSAGMPLPPSMRPPPTPSMMPPPGAPPPQMPPPHPAYGSGGGRSPPVPPVGAVSAQFQQMKMMNVGGGGVGPQPQQQQQQQRPSQPPAAGAVPPRPTGGFPPPSSQIGNGNGAPQQQPQQYKPPPPSSSSGGMMSNGHMMPRPPPPSSNSGMPYSNPPPQQQQQQQQPQQQQQFPRPPPSTAPPVPPMALMRPPPAATAPPRGPQIPSFPQPATPQSTVGTTMTMQQAQHNPPRPTFPSMPPQQPQQQQQQQQPSQIPPPQQQYAPPSAPGFGGGGASFPRPPQPPLVGSNVGLLHPGQQQQQQMQQVADIGGVGGFPQAPMPSNMGSNYPAPPPMAFGGGAAAAGAPPPPPSPSFQQQQQQQPGNPAWAAPPSFGMNNNMMQAGGIHQHPQQQQQAPPEQQQQQGLAGRSSLDPGVLPHPPPLPPPKQVFNTRIENTHAMPPPVEFPIVVKDYGSAGPRYMRFSLNSVPQGADMLKSGSVPFVVVINALAIPEPGDDALDVVDAGPAGPLRCAACKAYVCSYMRWVEAGRRMECCFCGAGTDVPPDYFSHIALDGARRDASERPELMKGSVEFEVGGEYMVRPPVAPTFFFLIEVTSAAMESGATAAACASVAQLLDELPGGDRTRVGIATFDSTLHFYSPKIVNNGGGGDVGQASMLIVPDTNEPFSPLGGDAAAVNVSQQKPALKALLESIPKMFSATQVGESAGGAALHAAVDALKNGVGGRVVAFLATLPRAGALALRPREAGRPPSERDNLEVLTPEGKEYAALAETAAEHQVSIDIFALTQGYIDLATLSTLSTTTSGSVHRYSPFVPGADSARFHNDLRWCLLRPQGLEAIARLRVSAGLAVDNYVGSCHRRHGNPTDLHFPAVSCEHALAARIMHEERLREGSEAYFQYALLYTTTEGRRRVRVHTTALPVSRSLSSVYRGADLDTYMSYVARKVSVQLPGRTIAACRDVIFKAAIDTLTAYKKWVAAESTSGQLIMPETLRFLPLYSLGLSKLPCFRTDSRADSRAVWMHRLLTAPVDRMIPALHPRLFEVSCLPDLPANAPKVPGRMFLTVSQLDQDRAFFFENGFDAYIFVGSAVPPEICMALLGVPSAEAVDTTQFAGPPVLDNPLSVAVRSVVDEVRRQRRSYMHLRLMRRGHPAEAAFMASLIEDRSPSAGMSYVEFLSSLHKQIQNRL